MYTYRNSEIYLQINTAMCSYAYNALLLIIDAL